MTESESSQLLTEDTVATDAGPDQRSSGQGSGVSFGSVHVHEHRMTLGSNPEVRRGVPVELAWDVEESNVFSTVDEFEEQAHGEGRESGSAKRIAAWKREAIAEAHHSRESIVRVETEIQTIQQQRHDSQRDKAAKHVVDELQREPHATVIPPSKKVSRSVDGAQESSKGWMRLFSCCRNTSK
jgi:hypothetical protein